MVFALGLVAMILSATSVVFSWSSVASFVTTFVKPAARRASRASSLATSASRLVVAPQQGQRVFIAATL